MDKELLERKTLENLVLHGKIMNISKYQEEAFKTAIYPNKGNNLVYPVLGLVGESGELANVLKKMFRDDNGKLTDGRREKLISELGDVLWYIAAIATELGINLHSVAIQNIQKLTERKNNDTLKGDGEERKIPKEIKDSIEEVKKFIDLIDAYNRGKDLDICKLSH